MKRLIDDYSTTSDDKVRFYDGFIFIISHAEDSYIDEDEEYHEPKYSIDAKCLCPEYDKSISLKDIARDYPKVCKVIYEDALRGAVYNYKNHIAEKNAEAWELVGELVGYA